MSEPRSRIRVIDLETAGNGPDDVCEIGWQDVEQGDDGLWRLSDAPGSRLVNPGRPNSLETMAVHHILDEQVSGAPFWKAVAPEILRRKAASWRWPPIGRRSSSGTAGPHLTGGAGWICTWISALRLWPELPSFSNQRLRYQRRPEGLVHEMGLPAHRALPDAYITAHHLRDMLNEASADQLLAWSQEPGLLPRVPAGADRGKAVPDLGDEALRALARDRDADLRFSAEPELRRRGEAPTPPPSGQQSLL